MYTGEKIDFGWRYREKIVCKELSVGVRLYILFIFQFIWYIYMLQWENNWKIVVFGKIDLLKYCEQGSGCFIEDLCKIECRGRLEVAMEDRIVENGE